MHSKQKGIIAVWQDAQNTISLILLFIYLIHTDPTDHIFALQESHFLLQAAVAPFSCFSGFGSEPALWSGNFPSSKRCSGSQSAVYYGPEPRTRGSNMTSTVKNNQTFVGQLLKGLLTL